MMCHQEHQIWPLILAGLYISEAPWCSGSHTCVEWDLVPPQSGYVFQTSCRSLTRAQDMHVQKGAVCTFDSTESILFWKSAKRSIDQLQVQDHFTCSDPATRMCAARACGAASA